MRLEGKFSAVQESQAVERFLSDLRRIGPCLPDVQELEAPSPSEATVKVKAGVGFVRGTMTIHLTSTATADQIQYAGKGSGMGSAVDLTAGFRVHPQDQGSLVEWYGEAKTTGTIASLGGGLLDQVTRKTVRDMLSRIETSLQAWDPAQDPL
jgi:uncharacterized protein